MTDIVAEYQALIEQKRALAERIKTEGASILATGAKAIFATHPVVGSFGWVQYTPSFNDGDPCKFTRGDTYIFSVDALANGGVDDEDDEEDKSSPEFDPYSDANYSTHCLQKTLYRTRDGDVTIHAGRDGERVAFDNPDFDRVYGGARAAVETFVSTLDNELLEAIFGENGTKVTITREGVDVTEYDCGY